MNAALLFHMDRAAVSVAMDVVCAGAQASGTGPLWQRRLCSSLARLSHRPVCPRLLWLGFGSRRTLRPWRGRFSADSIMKMALNGLSRECAEGEAAP